MDNITRREVVAVWGGARELTAESWYLSPRNGRKTAMHITRFSPAKGFSACLVALGTLIGVLVTAPGLCWAAPVFVNGSFEADIWNPGNTGNGYSEGLGGAGGSITGWTAFQSNSNGFYLAGMNNAAAVGDTPYGSQYVVLGPTGVGGNYVEQVVGGFTPGDPYRLTFAMASEYQGEVNLRVLFPDGSASASADFTAPPRISISWDNWLTKTHDFVPTSSAVTFRFLDLGSSTSGYDVGLDNLSITQQAAIPEPSSIVLLTTSLVGISFALLRRRGRKTGGGL